MDQAGDTLRDHVAMLHELAAGIDGKLLVASYGQNPDSGADIGARVQHFRIGDVDGMAAAIRALGAEKHRNVYAPLTVVRPDLPDRERGTKADVVAVLGLCGDFDDADAGNYAVRLPMPANYVLETSPGRFQAFYVFANPVEPAAADAVAVRLKAHARCDHGSADFSHVWRLPDTLNWPNQKKVTEGRKREPQPVRVAVAWDGTLTDFDALATALPGPEPKVITPAAEPTGEGINFDELPEDLRKLIAEGVPRSEDRSKKFHYVVGALKERGAGLDPIEALLAAYPAGIAEKYSGRLRSAIEGSYRKVEGRREATDDFQPVDTAAEKPIIKIAAGTLHDTATLAETALIKAGAPLYVRGPRIVRPVVEDVDAAHGRKTKVARLTDVTPDVLVDRLSRAARWIRYDARAKKEVSADPPRLVASTILSRDGEWRFPRLAGVITTPTLRPDGSLLTAPGYDPQTRLLLIDPPAMPDIPAHPTKADAKAALELLTGLLVEFPFVDESSRAAALSAMISAVARGALPVVPLHLTRAPAPAMSKSYLFDTVAVITTGQRCPVISAGASEEETEKRLGAAVMTGQPIVSIDNLNGELGGDALCQIVERPVVEIRPLGRSELVRIESRATIFATGNNIVVVGDMVRRVLVISLDANMERPEQRQFKQDPIALVLADRGRYVAACLVIARAYLAAGCPDPQPALASFGEWSRLVRSALVWLGCADPCETMETARAEDPETAALTQVVTAWRDAIGAVPLTVAELVERAICATENEGDQAKQAVLREALMAVAGVRKQSFTTIDARTLGYWLRRRKGRIASGLKIIGTPDLHAKQIKWSLWSIAGDAGNGGTCFSPIPVSVTVTDSCSHMIETLPAITRITRKSAPQENGDCDDSIFS